MAFAILLLVLPELIIFNSHVPLFIWVPAKADQLGEAVCFGGQQNAVMNFAGQVFIDACTCEVQVILITLLMR